MTSKANPCARAVLAAGVLLIMALSAPACGHDRHYAEPYGFAVVDNRTDLTTNEQLLDFRMAAFGQPFSGDLLSGPLGPLSAEMIGVFPEGYYDAEGELELGEISTFFDEFVGVESQTIFEVR